MCMYAPVQLLQYGACIQEHYLCVCHKSIILHSTFRLTWTCTVAKARGGIGLMDMGSHTCKSAKGVHVSLGLAKEEAFTLSICYNLG